METNKNKKPWWYPQLDDGSDEGGRKYRVLWDHIGDAYGDYEPLADAYLAEAQLSISQAGTLRIVREMIAKEYAIACGMIEGRRSYPAREIHGLMGNVLDAIDGRKP